MGSSTTLRAEALNGTLGSEDPFAALSQTYLHQSEPLGLLPVDACGRGYPSRVRGRGNNRPNDQARVPSVTARPLTQRAGLLFGGQHASQRKGPERGPWFAVCELDQVSR